MTNTITVKSGSDTTPEEVPATGKLQKSFIGQATSVIGVVTVIAGGGGVSVIGGVGVDVAVEVEVGVGVTVAVGVDIGMGVEVGVNVGTVVGVGVGVPVGTTVGVRVGVGATTSKVIL